MNQSPRELGPLRKEERIGGLIYLPMFLIGTQYLAVLIVLRFRPNLSEDELLVPVNLVFTGLNAAALCLIFHRYLAEQFRRIQLRGWSIFTDLLLGFLTCYGLSILASYAVQLLQILFGTEYLNANQEAVNTMLFRSPAAAILAACVLAPISEELLFRGLIFCGLYRRSRKWAYAVSMLSFAFVHVMQSMFSQPIGVTLTAFSVYLPHGFALAWTYERSGSIWSAIFLHASLNTLSFILLCAIR